MAADLRQASHGSIDPDLALQLTKQRQQGANPAQAVDFKGY
jgi:hypothetical protein